MTPWQLWTHLGQQQRTARPQRRTFLELEALEDRALMSATVLAPGFTLTTFATSPNGASQPDSIAVDGRHVFVGYGNGVAKDGSDGKSSTIVEYTAAGAILQSFSVPGHNDGLKVDPETHLVWALQNEDGNPNLVVIDPAAGTQTQYRFGPVANGGGFDDITFLDDKVFLTESNPSNNPNTDPAVVRARLNNSDHTVEVTTVLLGNAMAKNLVTKRQVTLNLQDPDSMTADRSGNLVFTSQADDEIVTIHHPGTKQQFVTLLPLPVSVDDTLFLPQRRGGEDGFGSDATGVVLVTDQGTGTIYALSGPGLQSSQPLTAALDVGEVGHLDVNTGTFTPIVSGLANPRGLAFLGTQDGDFNQAEVPARGSHR